MKFRVNRERGWFLSENFLPWTFCPRYIQPGLVGAFPKCLMAQAGPEGPSGEFLRYKSSFCSLRVDVLNYNPSHPTFHLLAGEGGKRSPLAGVKMRTTLWLLLSVFGRLRGEPSVTAAAARDGSSKGPGNGTNLSISPFLSCFSPDELLLHRSGLLSAVEGSITNGNSLLLDKYFDLFEVFKPWKCDLGKVQWTVSLLQV